MWKIAQKLVLASITTLLTATASLSAGFYGGDSCDNSCNPCNPCNNDCFCGDWCFEAEVLYWRTNVDELPIGQKVHTCTNPTIVVPIPGDGTITVTPSTCNDIFTKYLDFDWRPGARATLGYKSPCYCWDFNLTWTWLHSKAHASLDDDEPFESPIAFILPAWISGATPPFNTGPAGPFTDFHIEGDWGLNYNAVELGFGYTFCACCDQFRVRPHFDLKIASIRQRLTVRNETTFTGFPVTGGFAPFTSTDEVFAHRDYLGVGPQVGVDFNYTICGGLSFYGKAAAALLYAEPEIEVRGKIVTHSDTFVSLDFEENSVHRDRTNPRHINFNSTLGAGFAYSRWVCDCCYRLTFKLGWEHHFYTDQNQFHRAVFTAAGAGSFAGTTIPDLVVPVENGNLSLYGLTASICLDY